MQRISTVLGHLYTNVIPNDTTKNTASAFPTRIKLLNKVLVANRGEIAIRIFRAAEELGIKSVAIYTKADKNSLHVRSANEALCINDYLDQESILKAACTVSADAIHPGYGFLSENVAFAQACEDANICFVGPTPETLRQFGDKVIARNLAERLGVPILRGSKDSCISALEVRWSMSRMGINFPIMLKAVGGGGGRGIRPVLNEDALESEFERCVSEVGAGFKDQRIFYEEFVPSARHIEVQVLGDGKNYIHLFERDCSIQMRRQKMVEMAPARGISSNTRKKLLKYALDLAKESCYRSAGTFEFLLSQGHDQQQLVFIEANPRLQVEHTVSEEVTGIDIVQAQLLLSSGLTLEKIGLGSQTKVHISSYAVQARVTMTEPGTVKSYAEPGGRGVRVDSCCFPGYHPSPLFDPLLAKVICHAPLKNWNGEDGFELVQQKILRAINDFHIGGLKTNLELLKGILSSNEFRTSSFTTESLDSEFERSSKTKMGIKDTPNYAVASRAQLLDESFPDSSSLHKQQKQSALSKNVETPEGFIWIISPLQGQVVSINAKIGDVVTVNHQLIVLLSMKMEHVVSSQTQGKVSSIEVKNKQIVEEGQQLVLLEILEMIDRNDDGEEKTLDLNNIREDLQEILDRRAMTTDAYRHEHNPKFHKRVQSRHKRGMQTARKNINDLVDPETFIEYGRFAIASQRSRRSLEDLIKNTPADGVVAGIGRVNGHLFPVSRARTAILAYDYTVLAGTQGYFSHLKCDRLLAVAEKQHLPVIWFCEGGGGRPGDVDAGNLKAATIDCPTFGSLGRMSGLVPLVGLVSGYCFAGNAAMLGTCDVIIAVKGSNIGMGGPAMIEGGGLGVVKPTDIGPMSVQVPNGVVDISVETEAQAVTMAKKYLSYFQGSLPMEKHRKNCADQRLLRHIIPPNRIRIYEMQDLITLLVDTDSALFLRPHYGIGIYTVLARIAGRPLGILANNPKHLGGAIDGPAALKAARFMELCDAFDLPILFLVDCPGFMVGPESERHATVRKFCKMFVVGGSLTVPYFTIVTRKAYGLGAQAMSGGAQMGGNLFSVSWPSGEFGGMGLEGAVRLGFRKQLEQTKKISGPKAMNDLFEKLVAISYERGKAINVAMKHELDDVIDPAESRDLIIATFEANPPPSPRRKEKKRPCISTW